jgi:ABC-type transport system substrate-binding protein
MPWSGAPLRAPITTKGGTKMKHVRFRVPVTVLLVLVMLALVACQPAAPAGQSATQQEQAQAPTGEVDRSHRSRTLIITPWSDTTGPLRNPDNWNIYQTGNSNLRHMGGKTVFEALFYTNLNTGELIPWQAESYEYNDDFTSITVKLRQGVEWSDGQPFTCNDVKFTLEMLRDNAPDLSYSFVYQDWLTGVDCVDELTAVINLNRSSSHAPRSYLAGSEPARVHQL